MGTKYESLLREIRGKSGAEWQVAVYEIEKRMIQQFVEAVGDPNPLWQDEEYARKSGHGGIIAPPTFVVAIYLYELVQQIPFIGEEALNAGNYIEFYQPIRYGDVITITAKMTGVREREGKRGKMALAGFECAYTNQRQEMVAKNRSEAIIFEEVTG